MTMQTFVATSPCCCIGAFFLLFGGSMAAYGAQKYFLLQKIKNTPTSKVRSAAVGLVELKGKARMKDSFISPISKTPCAYWYVSAEYHHHEKDHDRWVTFHTASKELPFYVEDDTGRMLLDPAGAQIRIRDIFNSQGHLSDKALFGLLSVKQLDLKVLAYLDENPDVKAKFNAHSGTAIRVYEYCIKDGDELYALGSAMPIPGASSDVHEENLIVRKTKEENLLFISDSPEGVMVGRDTLPSLIYLLLGLAISGAAVLAILFSLTSFAT